METYKKILEEKILNESLYTRIDVSSCYPLRPLPRRRAAMQTTSVILEETILPSLSFLFSLSPDISVSSR